MGRLTLSRIRLKASSTCPPPRRPRALAARVEALRQHLPEIGQQNSCKQQLNACRPRPAHLYAARRRQMVALFADFVVTLAPARRVNRNYYDH